MRQRRSPCPGTAGGPGETSPGPGACPRGPREEEEAAAMEIPPQEAPPGPGADADADAEAETEEASAEAESPTGTSPPADGRLKAAAKRVTFPSDEDIVSGAVEPKDPWRHGSFGEGCGGEPRGGWDRHRADPHGGGPRQMVLIGDFNGA